MEGVSMLKEYNLERNVLGTEGVSGRVKEGEGVRGVDVIGEGVRRRGCWRGRCKREGMLDWEDVYRDVGRRVR